MLSIKSDLNVKDIFNQLSASKTWMNSITILYFLILINEKAKKKYIICGMKYDSSLVNYNYGLM